VQIGQLKLRFRASAVSIVDGEHGETSGWLTCYKQPTNDANFKSMERRGIEPLTSWLRTNAKGSEVRQLDGVQRETGHRRRGSLPSMTEFAGRNGPRNSPLGGQRRAPTPGHWSSTTDPISYSTRPHDGRICRLAVRGAATERRRASSVRRCSVSTSSSSISIARL
jgi:hypothetical protein